MENKKHLLVFPGELKKHLSFFLAVVMLVTMVSVGIIPMPVNVADAASSRSDIKTTYSWTLTVTTSNTADCDDHSGSNVVTLYGLSNNGTGGDVQIQSWGFTNYAQGGGTLTASGTSTSFPYKVFVQVELDAGGWRKWEGAVTLSVGGSNVISGYGFSFAGNENNLWNSQVKNGTASTSTRPSLAGVYIDGGSTTVKTNGSATSSYTIKGYDNYDVQWSPSLSNPSISSSHSSTSVSGSGTTRTVTFGNNGGVDYSTTISGSAGGKSTSGWQNVSVTVKTTHTLNVNLNGGGTNYTCTGYTGDTTAITTPSRTGYEFSSWSVDGGSMSGTTYTFANRGSSTITANWSPHTYTIAYDANGGTGAPGDQTKTYGTNLTLSSTTPTRTGYNFGGWDIYVGDTYKAHIAAGGTLSEDYVSAQGAVVTLKAKWTAKTFNVNFNGNTSTGGSMDAQQYTSGVAQNLTSNAFTKKHTVTWNYNGGTGSPDSSDVTYEFQGWSTSNSSTPSTNGSTTTIGGTVTYTNGQSLTLTRDSDLNLYAVWKTTSNSVTAPIPTRNGYDFDKWYANSNFTGTSVAGGASTGAVTSSYNMYANWTVHRHTITFTDSISTGTSAAGTKNYYITAATTDGAIASLPTPTKDGYTFKHWKVTTADGNWTLNSTINGGTSVSGKYGDPTLQAVWTPKTYTVTLDKNASDAVAGTASVTATYAAAMPSIATLPTRNGWSFDGYWDDATNGTKYYNADGSSAKNYDKTGATTLYAHWEINTYTITFNANGGNAVSAIQYNINGNQTLPSTTKEGYTFGGWQVTSNGGNWSASSYNSGTSVNGKYGNVTLKAIWNPKTFAVIFDGNGATSGSMSNQTFTSGQAQNLTNNAFGRSHTVTYNYNNATGGNSTPSATVTYTFDGWSLTEGSVSSSGNTTIIGGAQAYANQGSLNLARDSALTLYARWKATTDYVTLPTPTRNGYTFDGWWTHPDFTGDRYDGGDKVQPVTEDVQLYAKWNLNTYDITYTDSIGHGADGADTYDVVNTAGKKLADPTKTGYDFAGWKCTATSGSSAAETATSWTVGTVYAANTSLTGKYGNVTLEAQWTPHTYKFVYNANKPAAATGTVNMNGLTSTTKTYAANEDLSATEPTLDGWTFTGWKTADGVPFAAGATVNNDNLYTGKNCQVQLYAQWTENDYTVRFNSSLKTSGSMSNQAFLYETYQNLTENAFVREYTVTYHENYGDDLTHESTFKYDFKGWSTDNHESTYDGATNYADKANVGKLTAVDDAVVDLYAVWNGGSKALESFARTGYDLEGWYTTVSGSNYTGGVGAPGAQYRPTADTELFAKWVEHTYDIVYNANSGTGTVPASQTDCLYFTSYTVAGDTGALTKTGYTLTGWTYTKDDGTEGRVGLNGTVSQLTMNESITLYAEWTPNPYTVVFHMNDGTAVTASTTQTFDSAWVNVPDWSRVGYTLEGWYDNQACTGTAVSVTGTYRHDHNGTWDLYAKWVGLTYNVVYNSNTTDAVTGMPSPASVTKTYGTAITLASAPSRNGYQFLGWDTINAAATGAYAAEASFNADPADMTQGGTLNLYAIWSPVRYTITYTDSLSAVLPDASGTEYYYITASTDGAVAALKTPAAKTGYTFAGWYVTSNGGNWSAESYSANASVSGKYGNVTLEARWIPHGYTVQYYANGTNVTGMPSPSSVTKTYGTGLALAAAPARTGYTFKGWNVDADAAPNAVHMQPGNDIGDGYYTGESCTVNVYAIWEANTYTVRYDGNKPTAAAADNNVTNVPGNQTKTYDTALTLSSTEPGLTGYTFTGWNTAADGSGTPYAKGASMATDHATGAAGDTLVTLYAQWTPISYEVSFAGNGNTNDATMANQSFSYDEEKALTANAYEREYTVTYNYNNATGGKDTPSAEVEYLFAGWKNADGTRSFENAETVKNLRDTAGTYPLTAQWTPVSTVLPTPTRYGYEFGGWYSDAAFTNASFAGNGGDSYTPTADVTLHAKWNTVIYTITYKDSHNADYNVTQNYTIESTDVLAALTETGYDFAGWDVLTETLTPANWISTAPHFNAGYSLTGMYGNVTLEGQWTAQTYTVHYDGNLPKDSKGVPTTGTTTVPGDQTKTYGTDINLNDATPTLTGYTFVGWNTDATATTAEYAPSAVFDDAHFPGKNETVTLYAIWAPITYTVAFNGNGNTAGVMANQDFTYDVYKNLSPEGFTRIHTATYDYNYDTPDTTAQAEAAFNGWAFGGNTYTNEQEVVNLTSTAGATVTMTAQWTFGSVTLPTPTRTGYTFKGWFAEETCSTKLGDAGESYTLNADTTFYAKWEAVTYTVEYYAGTGASGTRPANQSVVYDTLGVNAYATEGSFKKPGYSFTGWNTVENGVGGRAVNAGYPFENTDLISLADANHVIRLYAQWTPNTYVIDYDKGAGTSGNTGSQTIRYDLLENYTVAENGFSYPGYTFTEWKAGNNVTYSEGAAVTSALLLDNGVLNTGDGYYHLTLTAQWLRNQSTLRVDHDNNDAVTEVTQDSGTTYNVDGSFTKTGYTFTGWALTGQNGVPNGSVSSLETKATVYTFGNENFVTDTLTAQWSKNPYTITYHYNVEGAPASEKSVTVYYDTEFTFAPEDYFGYRLGYTIDGWATSANGAIVYDCGQVSPATQNLATGEGDDTKVDLYAIWTAKEYEVTFWVNTGFHFADAPEAASQTKTITYGGSQTFTVVLEDGYTQSTGADPAAYVDEGTAAVPDGVKTGSTIVFTVTNHGESDVVVKTNPLALNTYTVTVIPESGDWNEADKGYRRPTVQSTVTHGSDVTFSITLLDGYNVASGADLITSATVGGTTVTPAVSGSYTYTVANATGDVVITLADALKNASTVKFDANGGKWAGDVTLVTDTNTYGAAYTVTAPSRDGYTFAGWQKVTEGENASTAAGSLSGNTYTYGTAQGTDYYTAQWTANTYTVVFDGNNGTPNTQTATATYGQTWPSPATEPTRTGYDFGGWCTDAEGTVSVNLSQNYMLLTGTTVYAKWTKHVYSITLDGTPEGYTVDYPQNANYLDNYTFTITPEEGYDVNAIDVNVTGNGGFTTSIDNGVMTVSVTGVNDNNVITVSGAMLTYNVITNLVNPEAFASQPATVTVTYNNTSGITVEVTMADGFQDTAPTVEVESTQTNLTASVTLKEGAADTYVIALSDAITADVTLNVTGNENIYDVTLNKGAGFVAPATETGTVAYLGLVTFTVELAAGYTDTQISDLSVSVTNGEINTLTKTDDTHILVVAESTAPDDMVIDLGNAKENAYTLTFINNGGDTLTVNTPVPAASSSIGYFDTFTFSITLAEGYTAATPVLDCDNSGVTSIVASKEGSVVTYTVKDYFTANTVLTLQKAAANTSTVTVALDGGTLAGVADGTEYTGAYKETRSFGTPSKTGYTFAGWALSSGANGALSGSTYTFGPTAGASDTITATWTANTYTVTFDANGGVPTTTTATATYNAAYPTVEAPTRTGYDFVGWFTAVDDTGSEITLGTDLYTLTAATTLYAHWDVHTSTLTVDPDGGKVVVGTTEYTAAQEFTGAYLDTLTVNDPTKTGYDFAGWTRTGNNGTLSGTTYTFGAADGAADTLTAIWTPKTYTVTYYTNDGTADYTTRTATYNAAWPEAPTVTWAGHTFDGWFTAADDTGAAASFEGNYTTADNTAVYAHWHINHSYVLFTFDGATMTVEANTYTGSFSAEGDSGDTVTIAVPEKTGYTFTGWTRTTAANGTLEGNTYTFGNAAGTAEAPETFVAQFTANTYTVTFDGNDGTPNSQTATATYGVAYPAPASAVTRTGYTFVGWFTAASGGTEVTPGTTVYALTEAVTLYAHWNIHSSTVTVKANGGNWNGSTDDLTYTENYGTAKPIPEPTRTGYTFNGWALTSEGTVNGAVSGNTYTFGPADGANDILTAQWTVNTSTVNVVLDGGTGATEGAYTQPYGDTLTLEEPTKTGYTFAGWVLSTGANGDLTGTTYTFGPAKDTTDTITATWTINQSTVTVKANGGNWSGSTDDLTYTNTYGYTQAIPVPTRTGYTFNGWALTSEGAVNGAISGDLYTFGPAADANDILTAQWTAKTYTVVYDANGGVPTTQTATATYNDAYPAVADPTRTGYDFAGWFTAADNTGTQITLGTTVYTLTSATTLYAHWTIHTSTVVVKANEGNWDGSTEDLSYTEEYGTAKTIPEPTREGYTFNGWALTSEGTVNGAVSGNTYTFGPAKNTTDILTAQWTINTSTVNVVLDGGTGATEGAYTQNYNTTLNLSEPTKEGYTFAGWVLADGANGDLTGTTYTFGAAKDTTDTITATWTINTSTVNVVLDGGTGETEGAYTQNYNTTLTLSVPTKTGYTFAGWELSTGANGSLAYNTYTFGPAKDAADTVTAQWTAKTYTVVYDANGGVPTTQTKTATYNAAYPTADEPTRTGYDFAGWFTAAEGGDQITLGTTVYTLTTGTTLYAHWTIHTSTLKVVPNGGSVTVGGTAITAETSYTQDYATNITVGVPTREGYHFTGWTENVTNGTFANGTYTFGAGKNVTDTLTANWEIDTFTVTAILGVGYEAVTGPQSPVDWDGTSYVTIRLDAAHSESGAPAATVNGAPLTAVDNHDGTFTYTVTGIREDKVIRIGDAQTNTYTVSAATADGAAGILSVTPTDAVTVDYGEGTVITVTLKDGYSASDAPQPTLVSGAATISGGVKSTVDGKTVYTYTVTDVTADSAFTFASATPNTYTVYYYRNDGTDAYRTESVTFDAAWPTAPTFTRTGWTKTDGWFTGPADSDPAFTFTDTYTTVGDTEVYAHWTINRSSLTVDPAGGSVRVGGDTYTASHTFEQAYNTTLTVEEPTREGYHFTGWTKAITNGSFVGDTYTFGATAGAVDTLTATWEIDTFTVTLETGVGYTVEEGPQSPVDWNGTSYVTIRLSTGYVNSPAPQATVNGAPLAAVDNGDGTFTYTVTGIKEDKAIVIGDATRDNCFVSAVKADGAEGIASFAPTAADAVSVEYANGIAYITVTLEPGYSASAAPSVTLKTGAATISAGAKSTVDGSTVYTYTVTNVTEDSVFEIGSATINRYDISVIADGTGYVVTQDPSGADVVDHGGSVTVKITLDIGYSASGAPVMELVSGAAVIPTGVGSTVDGKTVYTYTVTNVTADSVLRIGSAQINTYNVALVADGTGYTVSADSPDPAVVTYGGSTVVKLTLDAAHSNSAFPTVTVKNAADENIGTVIPSKNGNEITYTVYGITDNVTITVGSATVNTYVITIQTGEGAQIKNSDTGVVYNSGDTVTVTHGDPFNFELADPTLVTPVYVNGAEVTPNADGKFTLTVTQDTVITTNKLEYIALFQNYDGSVVSMQIVIRGNAAYCNTIPTKPSTEHHDYVFAGWLCTDPAGSWGLNGNMANMTENRVFVAQYTTYHKNLLVASDENNHWWYCPECDYTEGLAAHIEGGIEIENMVAATCTTKGSHDEVTYCAVCRYEMSRTTVDDGYDYTNHSTTQTYTVVLYQPTCTETGMKAVYCKACDHVVRYEEIPVNTNNHCWNAWTDNGDGTHTRGCVYCGQGETYAHALREIYRSAPTCVSEGCVVSYCPICATVIEETQPATGVHTPGDVYWENYVAPTCVDEGSYEAVRNCTVCGIEVSRTTETVEATGAHDYELSNVTLNGVSAPDLTEDDVTCGDVVVLTYTCRHCPDSYTETITVEHEYEWTMTAPAQGTPGSKTGVCTRCGNEITEIVDFEPLGQRHVQFVAQSGVTYKAVSYKMADDHTWYYDTNDVNTVKGTVTTYTNVDLHFFVNINSSFPYSDYDVYADGVKLTQNADGTYTLPASAAKANVSVLGTTPTAINPGDSGVGQGEGDSGSNSNAKLSFWDRIVAFFRSIGDFFRNMFSR